MSGLRVAFLSPCFWPEVRRGTERVIRDVADGLIERGHTPTLITSHPGRPTRTIEDGLRVIRNWRPPDGVLERAHLEHYLTHVPFSYLSLSSGEYDLAHAVYPTDALAAGRWSRRTGRPSVLAFHGIPDHRGLTERRLQLEITRRAVAGTDAVVASSRTAARAFDRWLGVEARVIYPGVDLDVFAPGGTRAERPTIFCAAAADEPRKRVPMLVAAHALVRRERPGAVLRLVRPADAGLAASLERADGVKLVEPVQDRAALAAHYRDAWVAALPSIGDSFGIVLVEALACGVPVVASDDSALPEVVDREEIGRLFDGDERALADALLEAIELSEQQGTASACRARAEDFSTQRCVAEHERLYAELLGSG